MKGVSRRGSWIILLLLTLSLFSHLAAAQSATPHLKHLLVELWPEYDQPEVLVIYRAELSPETSLPVRLTFRLPGYLDRMHVVAVEQNGTLFEVQPDAFELRHEGDDSLLTLSSSSLQVQFEYYDSVILTRQDQRRRLAFKFSAPYQIETISFEVQEPFQATDFSLTPEPGRTFTGNDGLKYALIETDGLAAGETFELSATYRRNIDSLSVASIQASPSKPAADSAAPAAPAVDRGRTLGYVAVGLGLALLVAAGGYWWWSERTKNKAAVGRSAPRDISRKPRGGKKRIAARQGQAGPPVSPSSPRSSGAPAPARSGVAFCYNCGTALHEGASFCHQCGAERRKE